MDSEDQVRLRASLLREQIQEAERARKICFSRKHNEFQAFIKNEESKQSRLSRMNAELMGELKSISSHLDDLIEESERKAARIEKQEIQVRHKKCDHLDIMAQIEQEIEAKQRQINTTQYRIDQIEESRGQEVKSVNLKIKQAQAEIASLKKKAKFNEQSHQEALSLKIDEIKNHNKDLEKEIKLLHRLQHHQGNRLMDLDQKEQYPEKIKQLMEERKFMKDKAKDTEAKMNAEMDHLHRQDNLIHDLATQISALRKELNESEFKQIKKSPVRRARKNEYDSTFDPSTNISTRLARNASIKTSNDSGSLGRLPKVKTRGAVDSSGDNPVINITLPNPLGASRNSNISSKKSSPGKRHFKTIDSDRLSSNRAGSRKKLPAFVSYQEQARLRDLQRQEKLMNFKRLKNDYSFRKIPVLKPRVGDSAMRNKSQRTLERAFPEHPYGVPPTKTRNTLLEKRSAATKRNVSLPPLANSASEQTLPTQTFPEADATEPQKSPGAQFLQRERAGDQPFSHLKDNLWDKDHCSISKLKPDEEKAKVYPDSSVGIPRIQFKRPKPRGSKDEPELAAFREKIKESQKEKELKSSSAKSEPPGEEGLIKLKRASVAVADKADELDEKVEGQKEPREETLEVKEMKAAHISKKQVKYLNKKLSEVSEKPSFSQSAEDYPTEDSKQAKLSPRASQAKHPLETIPEARPGAVATEKPRPVMRYHSGGDDDEAYALPLDDEP